MSNVLPSSQGTLDAFRTEQKSQHASQDAHLLARGLSELQSSTNAITAAIVTADLPNGSAKVAGTVTTTIATGAGTVTAGAVFVSFENTGAVDVTVNGQVLKPDRSRVFPTSDGMKLPAITYTATGGNLTIDATYPPA